MKTQNLKKEGKTVNANNVIHRIKNQSSDKSFIAFAEDDISKIYNSKLSQEEKDQLLQDLLKDSHI